MKNYYVQYPAIADFLREYNEHSSDQFKDDILDFCRNFPELIDELNRLTKLIEKHPYPPKISKSVWEILKYYSLDLDEYINTYYKGIRGGVNLVCSVAIYEGSSKSLFKKVDKSKDIGLRLVYEIVNTDHIIYTNLNYHIYRNSSYCDNSEIGKVKFF